jgi:phage nucleotide-binding protein
MTIKLITSNTKSKQFLKALIYSDPGVGKTTLAATANQHPDLKQTLLVNIDKGDLSLEDESLKVDKVTIGVDDNGISTKSIITDLETVLINVSTKKPGWDKYSTVIVDTVTHLQEKDLLDIAAGKDLFSQQDYNKSTTKIKKLCAIIRDAQCHIILTAQVSRVYEGDKPENRKLVQIRPDITAKASDALQQAVNFVWFLTREKDSPDRALYTAPQGIIRAKTRNGKFAELLGQKIVKPSIPDIYNKMLKAME